MKFFVFGGGLGNQLFQYSYYRYLKKKYPSERILGIYPDSLKAHNGIEIDKWFDIELPRESVPVTRPTLRRLCTAHCCLNEQRRSPRRYV